MLYVFSMHVPLFASVTTGFESVAKKEVEVNLGNSHTCESSRGHIRFAVPADDIPKVLKLRSIDNVYAVLYEYTAAELQSEDEQESLEFIKGQVPLVNWANAIEWWQRAHGRRIFGGSEYIKSQMKDFMTNGNCHQITEDSPSFRVTCNRAGNKTEHSFSSMTAARLVGAQLNNIFGWKPDMKNFDIEIIVNIRKDTMLIMISLNNETLFKRNIVAFGPTTLRSTLCYCMVSLANPKPGDILLDPMCGGGSIAIEGTLAFPGIHFMAGDNHTKALERCCLNRDHNRNLAAGSSSDFFSFDAAHLPLRDSCIDSIVTDMPFGKKIGSVDDNRIAYPLLLREWERVVVPGGRAVVLTKDRRTIENILSQDTTSWRLGRSHMVNIGGLTALCGVLVNEK